MMKLRPVTAGRYVTPLREGGSLPAIIEADDDGLYVLKFRGAGQGPKALIAELLAGEIGRAAGLPVIYTTPVSRADGADVVMLPTDLSAETGLPPLSNAVEGTAEAGFPDEIAPRLEDYVFLKRRPSAFYGTGVAELLHMLRRDIIIIGGGATNRGVETSVREAFNLDLASVVVRECCWSGDPAAHAYSLDKAMKMYARIRSLDEVAAMLRE